MGPKIFVFHVSQIIKITTFVVIGLIVLFSLIFYFTSRSADSTPTAMYTQENAGQFIPGTYRAKVYLSYLPVFVEVTVTEEEIVSIVFEELTDNQLVFYPLLEPTIERITYEIVSSQDLQVTSTYEDAVTSKLVFSAVYRALNEARINTPDLCYVYNVE